uniref:hypothetical protein n=1 Tax=Amycolatopsis sp. CA-096443 TaxID=3239919 RepID=UPI003F499A66
MPSSSSSPASSPPDVTASPPPEESKFQLKLAHVATLGLLQLFVGWMITRGFSPAVSLGSAAGCAGIVVGMCAAPRAARKFMAAVKAMS